MRKNLLVLSISLVFPALVAAGCSEKKDTNGDDCLPGHEGCECSAESTCLSNLVCESGKCVVDDMQGSGGAGSGVQACVGCWDAQCSTEHDTCGATESCVELSECLAACVERGDFIACPVGCNTQVAGATSEGLAAYGALLTCARASCNSECFTETATGTGGADGTGGGDTGTGGAGTGGAGTGGAGTGGMGTGGMGAGGMGGMGTGGSSTTVHWLSFEESWADGSVPENEALGVSGGLYAYGDDCATFDWDAETRCLSGQLCSPGVDFENWGVAVGFDFNNTGSEGEPADTKMPWDALAQEVVGLAWEVSGTAPGLQVWVTNMDPVWDDECTADDCAIDGPPDGRTSTLLNTVDQLRFDGANFVKDDWGGGGVYYTFDQTNLLALQFKLASVVSGPAAFNFCVDQIGAVK